MKKTFLFLSLTILGCGTSDGFSIAGVSSVDTYVYTSNYGSSTISTFLLEGIDLIRTSSSLPTGAGTSNPNSLATSAHSNFLISANYISANLSVYSISPSTITTGGQISEINPTSTFSAGTGVSSVVMHPTSPWVYATLSGVGGANILVKSIDANGVLSTTSTASAGTNPYAIAMHPSGTYLYVANLGSNNVTGFSINPTTGALSALAGSPYIADTSPQAMAMDPFGRFLYVLNTGANTISSYTINSSTGVLTPTAPASIAGGGVSPSRMAIDPSGLFLFLTNSGSNNISVFSINSVNGLLSSVAGSPFNDTGLTQPMGVAVSPTGDLLAVAFGGEYKLALFYINTSTGAITSTGTNAVIGETPRSVIFRQQSVTR